MAERSAESGTPPPLTAEDIVARVQVYSTAVVDELYDLAKARIDEEEQRNESLRSRATALVSAAGLSITLSLTFVGLLLQNAEFLHGVGNWFTVGVVLLFAGRSPAGLERSCSR